MNDNFFTIKVESLYDIKWILKCRNNTEVLEVHKALQKTNERINKKGIVPVSLLILGNSRIMKKC